MISERTAILKSFDGTDLFFRVFVPKRRERRTNTKGLILAVHGFGEHSGRHAELAEYLCAHNLALASFDLRGHGKSGPRRGDAENLHAMVCDVIFVMNHVRNFFGFNASSKEFFGILGENFGATLVVYAATLLGSTCPPLFLASPLLSTRQKVPTWKKVITHSLPRVAPILQLPRNLVSKTLNNPAADSEAADVDELVLTSVTTRMEEILLQATDSTRLLHSLSLVQASVTVACGANDNVLDLETLRALMPTLGSESSEFHLVDGAPHELFSKHSKNNQEALQLVLSWTGNQDSQQ